jgi:hypothetical protein
MKINSCQQNQQILEVVVPKLSDKSHTKFPKIFSLPPGLAGLAPSS